MSEMIELVAWAIADSQNVSGDSRTDFAFTVNDRHRNAARAAIAKMREPTRAMVGAGAAHVQPSGDCHGTQESANDATAIYRAMIDAALRP